ncbi:MAG TPA: peptide deformylase [Acetobacteraceae bacterium]|nr:peptide deformylase [Acetobacteraceae bacterium]
MAILKIARMGHPVLLRRAEPVTDPAAPEIRRLIADMAETLADAGGVGLAAPQVHVPLRLFIYFVPQGRAGGGADDEVRPLSVVINPEITEPSGESEMGWEGCLSIPGLTAAVPRASRIVLTGTDETGARFRRPAAGFHARVIQHEADHLDGILYLSRMRDHRLIGYNEEIIRFRPEYDALAGIQPKDEK